MATLVYHTFIIVLYCIQLTLSGYYANDSITAEFAYGALITENKAHTPLVGSMSCNSRFNGTTTDEEFSNYIKFEISNITHAVEIDTCASSYNTKFYVHYYFDPKREGRSNHWDRFKTCDNCGDNLCYPGEGVKWNLQDTLKPGYYLLQVLGYQDNTGNYSVNFRCGDILPLYVSKSGSDHINCGLDRDYPCGTIYYASTLIDNDYTEIFVIDGQNETEITSQYQCLPKIETEYIYFVYFDTEYITSMSDWYPEKCNNNRTNKYLFEHTKDLKFRNLIVDDYMFTDQGLIYTESHMECYNCTFRNLSFVISDESMDIIYIGSKAFIEDTVFDTIYMPNDGDFINSDFSMQFRRNQIESINIMGNFMSAKV